METPRQVLADKRSSDRRQAVDRRAGERRADRRGSDRRRTDRRGWDRRRERRWANGGPAGAIAAQLRDQRASPPDTRRLVLLQEVESAIQLEQSRGGGSADDGDLGRVARRMLIAWLSAAIRDMPADQVLQLTAGIHQAVREMDPAQDPR